MYPVMAAAIWKEPLHAYKGAELVQLVRWMTLNQGVPVWMLQQPSEKKSARAVGQGTLPKFVLDIDHLLSPDYEYGNGALEYVQHTVVLRCASVCYLGLLGHVAGLVIYRWLTTVWVHLLDGEGERLAHRSLLTDRHVVVDAVV